MYSHLIAKEPVHTLPPFKSPASLYLQGLTRFLKTSMRLPDSSSAYKSEPTQQIQIASKIFFQKNQVFFKVLLFIYKENMKLKITINQLREVLKTQPPKYPIEIMMSKVDQSELLKIGNLLKKKS